MSAGPSSPGFRKSMSLGSLLHENRKEPTLETRQNSPIKQTTSFGASPSSASVAPRRERDGGWMTSQGTPSLSLMQSTQPTRAEATTSSYSRTTTSHFTAGRDRSGSASTTASGFSTDSHDSDDDSPTFILAVIGTLGCGKSMLVKKAMKASAPSDPQIITVPASNGVPEFTYVIRVGRRRHSYHSSERLFSVVELDSEVLATTQHVWPDTVPNPDGVLLCYDMGSEDSFKSVRVLLKSAWLSKLPTIVLACRSDLSTQVDPRHAAKMRRYDVGLVVVNSKTDIGKTKIRDSFDWLLKAVVRNVQSKSSGLTIGQYRNPASPNVLFEPTPWDDRRSDQATPKPDFSGSSQSLQTPQGLADTTIQAADIFVVNDLDEPPPAPDVTENNDIPADIESPTLPTPHWQPMDCLLSKFIFVCISGDDPVFVRRFLLIYRCFTSPRTLLLHIQRSLHNLEILSPREAMFTKFAQARLCQALSAWTRRHSSDFSAPGSLSALQATAKTVTSRMHLLHHASALLSFIETVRMSGPDGDSDAEWAVVDDHETNTPLALEEHQVPTAPATPEPSTKSRILRSEPLIGLSIGHQTLRSTSSGIFSSMTQRDRKGSLPPRTDSSLGSIVSGASESVSDAAKLHEILLMSEELALLDSRAVAEEITRRQLTMFSNIKEREWILWMFRYGKKQAPETPDQVAVFLDFVNLLADWVASLVLCHDKAKARVRQLEKLIDIAHCLRENNNYSGCRAFVAGINACMLEGDLTMTLLAKKSPEKMAVLDKYSKLFKNVKAHGHYRHVLQHTKGACVPDVEVHASDLLKAHANNVDFDPSDSTRLHWAKWNMLSKFILEMVSIQEKNRAVAAVQDDRAPHMTAAETMNLAGQRAAIAHLWRDSVIMSHQAQQGRMEFLPDVKYDDSYLASNTRQHSIRMDSRSDRGLQSKDSILRKLFR